MKITFTKEQMEYFRKQGRRGGLKTKRLYGANHFKKMAEKKLSTATPLAKVSA